MTEPVRKFTAAGPKTLSGSRPESLPVHRSGIMPRALTLSVGIAATGALVACTATEGGDDILGYDWQVSAVFDDPELPSALPPEVLPPSIVFGHVSYTGSSSCGEFGGDLDWSGGDTVEFRNLDILREQDCSASAAEFDRRLLEQLTGESTVTVSNGELRVSSTEDAPPGEARRGFAAITAGAGAS